MNDRQRNKEKQPAHEAEITGGLQNNKKQRMEEIKVSTEDGRILKRRIRKGKLAGTARQMNTKKNAADAERMETVKWENANQLDIRTILYMVSDGYRFTIDNGRISSVGIRTLEAA